jgi:sialate O-acetylesterase
VKSLFWLLLALLVLTVQNGFGAGLKLAQPFQDHMVLQRQKPVPTWGWTDPGKTVTVKIADQQASGQSNDTGYWRVNLPAMEANSTGQAVTVTDGTTTLTLNDVLIGEVWICAGQSNMARPVAAELSENPQIAGSTQDVDYPLIRYINYPNAASDTPLSDMDPIIDGKAAWVPVNAQTFKDSMCMPFFFARNLYKQLQVPIGLVQIAVSGTTQTAWAAPETLDAVKVDGPHSYSYEDLFTEAEKRLASGKDPYKSWKEYAAADAAWRANPTGRPPASLNILDYPSVLYNGLVHPLAPMALRGIIWHQGEAGPFIEYGPRLVATINQWRKLYEQDFYFIWGSMTRFTNQTPPLAPIVQDLRSNIDEEFLEGQKLFGYDSKSSLCGFIDLGNPFTHWERKDEAGRRMVLAALNGAYGQKSVFTGPQLIESTITGSTIRCRFADVGSGLRYQPSIDGISGFVLQGQGTSVWATPQIEGQDTLVFSDPAVPAPTNLYYGWHTNPHETLFNNEGFPAYAFRIAQTVEPKADAPPASLVTIVSQVDPKAALHVSEVRRYAYVFGFLDHKGAGSNTVKAYIPKEWDKPAVAQDGKDQPAGDMTTDAQGNRFINLQVDTNASPLVVYDGSKPDALAAANTHRF